LAIRAPAFLPIKKRTKAVPSERRFSEGLLVKKDVGQEQTRRNGGIVDSRL